MPEGILIDYNDGRPVMAITAGLRAPSFCTNFSGRGTAGNQMTISTPLTSGSQVIVVPTKPAEVQEIIDNQVFLQIPVSMASVARNGNSGVIINGGPQFGYNLTPQDWRGTVLEILPAGT
ncbi:DUF6453 family protein, partial [Citrobacter amalonaticus]